MLAAVLAGLQGGGLLVCPRPTLFRLPKPSLWMASCFQLGRAGLKAISPAFRQPKGIVTMTATPSNLSPGKEAGVG